MFSRQQYFCTVVANFPAIFNFVNLAHAFYKLSNLAYKYILSPGYKLACTAIKLSASYCATATELFIYRQVTVPKGAIIARTGLRSDIHLRERPRINNRPCIVQVFKLTQPLCEYVKVLDLAIVQVYSNNITQRWIKTKLPAYLQGIHN